MSGILKLDESQTSTVEKKTPFMLYVDRQNSEKDFSELRKEYANLSLDQQYELIVEAVKLAPESVELILSKDEQRIYKGQIKQTSNAYNLYVKDMWDDVEANTPAERFSQIALLWKKLDKRTKKKYTDAAAEVNGIYI